MKYWLSQRKVESKEYTCGFCGANIASEVGYCITSGISSERPTGEGYIYICHKCYKPTFFDWDGKQLPGKIFGKNFEDDIFPDKNTAELYKEIQECMKASCFTSAVLSARNLLMHFGVYCGAELNLLFIYYVNYLDKNGYVSQNCKKWVDIIRKKGNEANHEIYLFNENDAKQIIKFVEIMISVIYEMPYEANLYEKGLSQDVSV